MSKHRQIRLLVPLAALGLLGMSAMAGAQSKVGNGSPMPMAEPAAITGPVSNSTQPQQPTAGSSASDSDASSVPAYDLAPAMARASFAQADYDRATATLMVTLNRVRQESQNSPEMVAARRELDEARHNYDVASQAALAVISRDPSHQSLVQQRDALEAQLHQGFSGAVRADIADRKMRIGSAITRIESDALGNDNNVRSARVRLIAAQQALNEKLAKAEFDLNNNQQVVAAKAALETARLNRAGAEGYLAGALATRDDIIAADERRYPNPNNIAVAGPWIGAYSSPVFSTPLFNPYNAGYFGFGGFGGVGGIITIGSGGHHHHRF